MKYFKTKFLNEAREFIKTLNTKEIKKVFYNIDLAQQTNDPRLLKKVNDEIWEFRTRYQNKQIRLLAFWDKSQKQKTLVIATNGFVKKTSKTPKTELAKAERLRQHYLNINS